MALPTHDTPYTPNEADDMSRLLSTADQIRSQVDELVRLREAALESAQSEARDVLRRAEDDAHEIIAEANKTATSVIGQANSAAGDTVRTLRDQLSDLIDAMTHRKSMLDTALSALEPDGDQDPAAAPLQGGTTAAASMEQENDPSHAPEWPSETATPDPGGEESIQDPAPDSIPKPGPLAPRTYSSDRFALEDRG